MSGIVNIHVFRSSHQKYSNPTFIHICLEGELSVQAVKWNHVTWAGIIVGGMKMQNSSCFKFAVTRLHVNLSLSNLFHGMEGLYNL